MFINRLDVKIPAKEPQDGFPMAPSTVERDVVGSYGLSSFVGRLSLIVPLIFGGIFWCENDSVQAGVTKSTTGIPVQIGWQVPLSREVSFILEVARDSGFSQIVLTTQVRGTGHLWVAPAEGVYHWRLAKADKKGTGSEVVSTVSGSFVALDPAAERKDPVRISWGKVLEADQYKIYMFYQEGRTRISTTAALFVLIPRGIPVTMVEVVPHKGAMSVEKSYHFLPTLAASFGVAAQGDFSAVAASATTRPVEKSSAQKAPVNSQIGTSTPKQDISGSGAAVSVPVPEENRPQQASSTSVEAAGSVVSGSRPLHRVALNGLFVAEKLNLDKLDLNLQNSFKSGGAEVRVWTSPVHGLVVGIEGSAWETIGDLERAPSQIRDGGVPLKTQLSATRFLGRVGLGYDFASLWDLDTVSMSVSVLGASSSQPMLPRIYKVPQQEPALEPEIKDEVITLGGGKVSLMWTGQSMGLLMDGYYLVDKDKNHQVSGQTLITEIYPFPTVALQIGAMAQQGQWVLCESDPTVCLAEGKVTTSSRVVGGLLGGSLILR